MLVTLVDTTTIVSGSPLSVPPRRAGVMSQSGEKQTPMSQVLQQRPGFLEVGGIEAFAEPAVDRCEQLPRFGVFALLLPQETEAHGRGYMGTMRTKWAIARIVGGASRGVPRCGATAQDWGGSSVILQL